MPPNPSINSDAGDKAAPAGYVKRWTIFMRRNRIVLAVASVIAPTAYAHGEDVLATFYAQAIAVFAILLCLRLIPAFRAHWAAGFIGCTGGVVVSWLATANMPYMEHYIFITAVDVITPTLLALLFVYVARRYASKSRRA